MLLNPIILNDLQTRLAEMELQIMTEPFSDHLWWGFNKNYKARCIFSLLCQVFAGFFLILKGGFHICNRCHFLFYSSILKSFSYIAHHVNLCQLFFLANTLFMQKCYFVFETLLFSAFCRSHNQEWIILGFSGQPADYKVPKDTI